MLSLFLGYTAVAGVFTYSGSWDGNAYTAICPTSNMIFLQLCEKQTMIVGHVCEKSCLDTGSQKTHHYNSNALVIQ